MLQYIKKQALIAQDLHSREKYLRLGIDFLWRNYSCKIDEEFLSMCLEWLNSFDKYSGIEYRFLTWQSQFKDKPIKINRPFLPIIKTVEINLFKQTYLNQAVKVDLFSNLIELSNIIKSKLVLLELPVLIGGSFVDISNPYPNDIDAVMLVPFNQLDNTFLSPTSKFKQKYNIDLKILPIDYDIKVFKAYSNLIYLGNRATNRHEEEKVANNTFVQIEVLEILI
jgi:hypothetical protein